MRSLPEFVLLTGALGSGKTTLLSDYLAIADTADTGVIVNDAGEINVDGAVISADNRDLALATLSDGCICCSMGNSLQDGIDALLEARAQRRLPPLGRVILETSGLAEPGPILRSLRQLRQLDVNARVITTFDTTARLDDENFLPQYAEQLAAAQVIVLTKLDAAGAAPALNAEARAGHFNALAALIVETDGQERARAAFDRPLVGSSSLAMFQAVETSSRRVRTALARWNPQATWPEIGEWIENISGYFGSRLMRMKGLVHPLGFASPLLVNGVGGVFSPPRLLRSEAAQALGLVMILRDVDPAEWAEAAGGHSALEVRFT